MFMGTRTAKQKQSRFRINLSFNQALQKITKTGDAKGKKKK